MSVIYFNDVFCFVHSLPADTLQGFFSKRGVHRAVQCLIQLAALMFLTGHVGKLKEMYMFTLYLSKYSI